MDAEAVSNKRSKKMQSHKKTHHRNVGWKRLPEKFPADMISFHCSLELLMMELVVLILAVMVNW